MSLRVERYERIFLYLTVVVLAIGMVGIVLSVAEAGIHLPDREARIDPEEVRTTPPFDQPGVYEVGDDHYEAVIVAQAFAFQPGVVEVPAGSTVDFIVTSVDVIHGLLILDTTVNAMVIPGQVTEISYQFDEAGEHTIVCHEFCGIGHHGMFGRVVVTP